MGEPEGREIKAREGSTCRRTIGLKGGRENEIFLIAGLKVAGLTSL